MIYDFTLNDSDVFSLPFGLGDVEVVDVDTIVLLDHYPRKRIILRHMDPNVHQRRGLLTWIDGIGATSRMDYYNDWLEHSSSSVIRYYDRDRLRLEDDLSVEMTDMRPSATWYSQTFSTTPGLDLDLDVTEVVGDTILDGRYCYILGVTSGGVYYPESELPVFVKDGQFFYYEDGTWNLLHDVSAGVGDTVHYTLSQKMPYYELTSTPNNFIPERCYMDTFYYVVQQVDTIVDQLGNAYRSIEVYNFGCDFNHEFGRIIEHVGPRNRLMGLVAPLAVEDIFPWMRCYRDDLTYFNFVSDEDCMTLTSTIDAPDVKVSIYPNPVEDEIVVSGITERAVPYRITRYSGRQVQTGSLVGDRIDVSSLPVGVYVLEIDGTTALKFVKL